MPFANAYAGIGSRKTPDSILEVMYYIAQKLAQQGVILRSGGAIGADYAFEAGCNSVKGLKEIFHPNDIDNAALGLAARFHPAFNSCSYYVKCLHGRNCYQIMGRDLKTIGNAVICWTPDGCISHNTRSKETGGTGTAISLAESVYVPIYNLALPEHLEIWKEFVKE